MSYTVKQLATLAGVTVRTLHYYDEIGLLSPNAVGENGYRYYEEDAVLRLQQIMFYRELDFSLSDIAAILERPDFNVVAALEAHKQALHQKIGRVQTLITTIDRTIALLQGHQTMSTDQFFEGFDDAKQKEYEQEAMRRYGEDNVKVSIRRWNNYTADEKSQIMLEGQNVYLDLVARIEEDPTSAPVQAIIARWHQHLRYFYEPTPDILWALGQRYADDPEFAATFTRLHPALPEFLRRAIEHYCVEVLVHV